MIKKYQDFIQENIINRIGNTFPDSLIEEVHQLCRKYGIKDYIINDDGSIDVMGNIALVYQEFPQNRLPLKFRKVTGWFTCTECWLTSLVGCPDFVGGSFKCDGNKLTSLVGCPKFIGGSFNCNNNKIRTFKGLEQVGKNFICLGNPIKIITNFFNKDLEIHARFIEVVNTYETLFPRPDVLDGDTLEQIAEDLLVILPIDWREQLEKVGYQVL